MELHHYVNQPCILGYIFVVAGDLQVIDSLLLKARPDWSVDRKAALKRRALRRAIWMLHHHWLTHAKLAAMMKRGCRLADCLALVKESARGKVSKVPLFFGSGSFE